MSHLDKTAFLILLFVIVLFVLVVFFVVLIYLFFNRIQNQKREAIHNLFKGQENERNRISRNIHDLVVPDLSNLKFSIDAAEGSQQFNTKKEEIKNNLNSSINYLRDLSHELVSDILQSHGLVEAIKEYLYNNKRTGVNSKVSSNMEGVMLNEQLSTHLFAIFKELYNNTLKHSIADKISLAINQQEQHLIFMYNDNGKGYNLHAEKKGIGLKNIGSRVDILKGKMQVDTEGKIEVIIKIKETDL